jgi:hypothetical protein
MGEDMDQELYDQAGRNYSMRDANSNGWISVHDLPAEKAQAIYARRDRESRQ